MRILEEFFQMLRVWHFQVPSIKFFDSVECNLNLNLPIYQSVKKFIKIRIAKNTAKIIDKNITSLFLLSTLNNSKIILNEKNSKIVKL